MVLLLIFSLFVHAEDSVKPIYVRDISMFRSQVVLNIYQNKNIKVGSKLTAQTAAHHKCLLTISRLSGDTAYADATQCPGFATLKKGQTVNLATDSEVNEEIHMGRPRPEISTAIKNLPAPPVPNADAKTVTAPVAPTAAPTATTEPAPKAVAPTQNQ